MSDLLSFIGDWGHALAAAGYAMLALWVARHRAGSVEQRLMATGLLVTALWALGVSVQGTANPALGLGEGIRNLTWLTFMFVLLQRGQGEEGAAGRSGAVTVIYGLVGVLLCLQAGVDVLAQTLDHPRAVAASIHASVILRLFVGIGALLLAHNLFLVAAPEGRARLKLPLAALAAMWSYDLNLYTIAWLADGDPAGQVKLLYAMRGLAMAALVPVLWLGVYRADSWTLRLSRAATFQSLSLVAIGAYLVVMALIASMLDLAVGPGARLFEVGLIFTLSVAAIGLLPSRTFRAWLKVTVAKHFFQHRYDYRTEWMRFAATLGRPGADGAPLYERVIRAVADITDSSAGLLLLRDESGALVVQADWNWKVAVPAITMSAADAAQLEASGWIFDIGAWRVRADGDKAPFAPPAWMVAERTTWALVPLIHFDRLTGAILLARPRFDRRPDWEDFDMLRAAGRQAASYISEAQGQAALSDARQFEEFNRRFAFIMHDIKNLVSQLSLVARNAERHSGNPEFLADMVLTLKDSVGKMNDLLARLSQHHKGRVEPPRPMALRPVIDAVVRAKERAHPILVSGDVAALALADPARVEQILLHLVQNAIDASPPGRPVTLGLGQRLSGEVIAEVIDSGTGMTADFIARELFKPFRSEKAGGFGIGAFEARSLAQAMGGRIEVQSRPGEGSRFTLVLPAAPAHAFSPIPHVEKAA